MNTLLETYPQHDEPQPETLTIANILNALGLVQTLIGIIGLGIGIAEMMSVTYTQADIKPLLGGIGLFVSGLFTYALAKIIALLTTISQTLEQIRNS